MKTPRNTTEAQALWDGSWKDADAGEAEVNADLMRLASTLSPGRALDLGCGLGQNALWLAEQGWQVVACDLSEVGLDKAREVARQAGARIDFRVLDAAQWRPDETFDLVVNTYALPMDGERRARAIRAAAAAVAPGGTLLLADWHRDASKVYPEIFSEEDLITLDEVLPLLEGLDVVQQEDGRIGGKLPDVFVVARRAGASS